MYPFSDVHLDPELYPDPWSFAPGRPQPEAPMSYVAWGAGKIIPPFDVLLGLMRHHREDYMSRTTAGEDGIEVNHLDAGADIAMEDDRCFG